MNKKDKLMKELIPLLEKPGTLENQLEWMEHQVERTKHLAEMHDVPGNNTGYLHTKTYYMTLAVTKSLRNLLEGSPARNDESLHSMDQAPKIPLRKCEQCGNDFPIRSGKARFCGGRCRTAAHRASSMEA